jgi:hypothetical protein
MLQVASGLILPDVRVEVEITGQQMRICPMKRGAT